MGTKGKDLCVFVRFGGVNLKKQKGYTANDKDATFHAPPAPRGIYSMPKVAQEFFLIGSIGSYQKGTMPQEPKYPGSNATEEQIKEWEALRDTFDWNAFRRRCDSNLSAMRKEFVKRTGNIWHHHVEYCNNAEVIARHGSWVKTSIKEWERAFGKMSLDFRYGQHDSFPEKSINNVRGITGWYSKDHCEVFFDEKI